MLEVLCYQNIESSIGLDDRKTQKILYNILIMLQANRAMSEHMSMSSRHRRKSVPHSFASGILGSTHSGRGSTSRRGRSSHREGSIDPLLLGDGGSYSDGEDSAGNRMSTGTLPLSVSRTELDRYV